VGVRSAIGHALGERPTGSSNAQGRRKSGRTHWYAVWLMIASATHQGVSSNQAQAPR
jgi:hypothetical protein